MRILTFLLCLPLFAGCALPPAGGVPRETAIVPLRAERPLVALALGSGGARGFAHVGVIKALEDAGIVPDIVTGVSSGAVVAALYASGRSGRELEDIARALDKSELVDFSLFGRGWVRGVALQDYVNRMVDGRPIERLARPLAIVATRERDGRMTVFNSGDTGLAVRASASVPNLFVAPLIGGEEYVDGGLTSPVPARLARAMGADIVIAVDVSWFAQFADAGESAARQGRGGRYSLLQDELKSADLVIVPRMERTRLLDFDMKEANIAAGEEAGQATVARLRQIIAGAAGARQARLTAAEGGRAD